MALNLVAKKSGKTLDLTTLVKKGGTWHVEAVAGEQYQLIDTETGKTPEGIKVARVDDNLVIKSADDKYEVILEEFWTNCSEDDNQLCYAVFDVPATESAQAGQVIITQVGEDVSTFKAGMVGTLPASGGFPLWAYIAGGALGLGAIAAAAGGGGGSDGGNNSAPQPKNTLLIDENDKDSDGNNGTNVNQEEAQKNGTVKGEVDPTIVNSTTKAVIYEKDGTTPAKGKNGLPVEAPVNTNDGSFEVPIDQLPDGDYIVKIEKTETSSNGNSTTRTIDESPLHIDTKAPDAPTLTGQSEDGLLGNGDGRTISGTAEDAEGGKAYLLDEHNAPILDGNKNPITANIDADGNFHFDNVPDGHYNVKVADKAGNESTGNTPIAVDHKVPSQPVISFLDDKNSEDSKLTRNEIGSDNKTEVHFTIDPNNTQAGDTLKINVNGISEPIQYTITQNDIDAKGVDINVPVPAGIADGDKLTISAEIVDTNNQSKGVTAPKEIAINRSVSGIVAVEFKDDKDHNQVLRANEIDDTANDKPTIIKVYLPNGIGGNNPDDKVTVKIGDKTYEVSKIDEGNTLVNKENQNDTLKISRDSTTNETYVEAKVPTVGKSQIDVKAEVFFLDKEGNPNTLSVNDSIRVDTASPNGTPALNIAEANDHYVNAAEAQNGVVASVTVPTGTQPGDHIILKDGNNILVDYTIPEGTDVSKPVDITIPKDKLGTDGDKNITATVQEADNGVTTAASNEEKFNLDTGIPGGPDSPNDADVYGENPPVLSFPQDDKAPTNTLNKDEVGTASDAKVNIELPTGTLVGDTVYLTAIDVNTGKKYESRSPINSIGSKNEFKLFNSNDIPDGTYTVTAYVQDEAGNRSEVSKPATITIDTTAPTVEASLSPDGKGLTVYSEPNTIITVDGKVIGTTDSNGDLTAPTDLKPGQNVTIQATDLAGNTSPVKTVTLQDNNAPTVTDYGYDAGKNEVNLTVADDSGKVDNEGNSYNNGEKVPVTFADDEITKDVDLTDGTNTTTETVYNPQKTDWLMNSADDKTGDTDHATGWKDNGDGTFTWKAPEPNKSDVIIASSTAQTESDRPTDTSVQGMIGAIDGAKFNMDTNTGGDDYIQSKGIGGNISISTNDGKDQINTGYMTGQGQFAGDQNINMGNDDDILNITGSNGKALDGTNATINMGTGSDKVTITGSVSSGDKGNIIDLGKSDNTGDKDTLTINGNVSGRNAIFAQDSSKIDIAGNMTGESAVQLGDEDDTVRIRGALGTEEGKPLLVNAEAFSNGDVSIDANHIDLGNGTNNLRVDGYVNDYHIVSGNGNDSILVGFDESKLFHINTGVAVNQTSTNTGAGDDYVMFSKMGNNVKVDTDTGNDSIETHGIFGTGNEIKAGEGDDLISLYGPMKSDSSNVFDGGAGNDKVIIGTAGDGSTDKFIIGSTQTGYSTIKNVETIEFNSGYGMDGTYKYFANSGDTVKIATNGSLTDTANAKVYIRGTDELNKGGTSALDDNTVQLDRSWQKTSSNVSDGVHSYTYSEYHSTASDDTLYIQNGITVNYI